jgi:hypothetical protein
MRSRPTRLGHVLRLWLLGLLMFPLQASAQTNGQFWGTVILGWSGRHRTAFELEIEPKALAVVPEGDPDWATLDVTPSIEYSVTPWLDAVGELATGYTSQTDDLKSFELSPRAGARFHLFSRDLAAPVRLPDRPSRRRVVVRDLVRVESRNLFYNGDTANSFTWRFRNRLELQVPLTAEKVNEDGARYFTADWEWFVPLGEPDERFANRQRIRAGFGYRRNARWRFEALYIWGRSRNTASDNFTTSDNILNLRMKHTF